MYVKIVQRSALRKQISEDGVLLHRIGTRLKNHEDREHQNLVRKSQKNQIWQTTSPDICNYYVLVIIIPGAILFLKRDILLKITGLLFFCRKEPALPGSVIIP
jgi:hypothetical protein